MTKNPELAAWIDAVAATTNPDQIHLVDGSDAENDKLVEEMLADGTLDQGQREYIRLIFSNPLGIQVAPRVSLWGVTS